VSEIKGFGKGRAKAAMVEFTSRVKLEVVVAD
jgi:hypothetical protein